jgi:hypothetical protein
MRNLLYEEDFDAPPPAPPPEPASEVEAPPGPPPITPADVELACAEAVATARTLWARELDAERLDAVRALAAGLDRLQGEVAAQVERVAEPLARAVLGMVAAALPELCRAHGEAEARALLRRVAPIVAGSGPLVVRAHASMLEGLRGELAELDEDVLARVELRAATLPPGDLRLSWPDGSVSRDAAALRAAIADELCILGLDVTHPERSLTLVK